MPSRRRGRRCGPTARTKSASSAASTTRAWQWPCSSTPTFPTRKRTVWRSPTTSSIRRQQLRGFYVNVQKGGEFEVVHPPPGVTSDSFLYQFSFPGQPIIYYTHSNVVGPGRDRSDRAADLRSRVARSTSSTGAFPTPTRRRPPPGTGMEVEFKFDDEATPGTTPTLYIKQARPYPRPEEVIRNYAPHPDAMAESFYGRHIFRHSRGKSAGSRTRASAGRGRRAGDRIGARRA